MKPFIFESKLYYFDGELRTDNGVSMGQFAGIKEAREYLLGLRLSGELMFEQDKSLTDEQIAIALVESGELRVTNTMVESIKQIIESKIFVPLTFVLEQRSKNMNYGTKIEYIMRDGSSVLIDYDTNYHINKSIDLRESSDFLLHMTKDSYTFMECVEELIEGNNGF